MKITDAAIGHRTTVLVFLVLIVFLGTASYLTVPREAFPEIEIPVIAVSTRYSDVAPAEIENNITVKIEKELKGLSDVEHISSTSRRGSSTIFVEFAPKVRSKDALQRVRDKVDEAKGEIPDEADEPKVSEIDITTFPIMMVSVHGPVGLVKLKEIAEDLEGPFEGIPGVLDAEVSGGLTRQIRILVDRTRLAAYQIPVSRFLSLIKAEERSVSAGLLKMGDFQLSVRVPGEFENPAQIFNLILDTRDGKPIYLSDVATVEDAFEDRTSIARFDGRDSVSIAIRKRSGENIIRIADQVKAIIEEARPRLPTGVEIATSLDHSRTIRILVADLENNMFTALVLVVVVLMLFLGLRTSLIVAMAIPFSMMITMAILSLVGLTLNFIVLFSLVLALGMMVDNSIVIVENIYRHRQEGLGRVEAAKVAAAEVGWPVITSTLTTLAAFTPMLFWPGLMGQVMGYLPRTLIIALSASLFVALVVNPTIAVLVMPREVNKSGALGRRPAWYLRAYAPILRAALRFRLATVLVAGLAVAGAFWAFARFNGKVQFFPSTDPDKASINITGPVGMRLEKTDALAREAEAAVTGFDNVQYLVTNVGSGAGDIRDMLFGAEAGSIDQKAGISIDFVDYAERRTPSQATIVELRQRLADLVGAEVKVEESEQGPPTGAPVNIEISGPDYRLLKGLTAEVKAVVAQVPGITNLKDDLEEATPELRLVANRARMPLFGLNTAVVGTTVKASNNGQVVGTYREGDDEYDIVVRMPEALRRSVADLEALTIAGPQGEAVPISTVTRQEYTSGLGTIRRKDHERVITVSADALPGYNGREVLHAVQAALRPVEAKLPDRFQISYTGEREEEEKARRFLSKAGVVAVLLIAMVLVTQFNSLALMFIILISVVLSWIGVFTGLTITGLPFGVIMGGVGLISLAGVVVNNAIVLTDYTQKLRRRGLDLFEAVIRAGQTRLRPVLLTAITTIMGLVPMALGFNFCLRTATFCFRSETSQWWRQMSVVIIFGLAFSTLFTLVVLPVLYTLFEQARQALRGPRAESAEPSTTPQDAGT